MRYDRFGEPKDYRTIALAALDPLTPPTEITEEEYFDALNVLPPVYVPGGFLICEAVTDTPYGDVHSMYAQRSDRYFARYVVRCRQETYIGPGLPSLFYPLEK